MNVAHIVGRVGRDPEIKSFSNGSKVANLSVATSRRWTDKATGEKREKTEWHAVKIQNEQLIDRVLPYVKKGDQLGLTGTIEYREWEKDGVKRLATDIVVGFQGELYLLSNKRDDTGGPAPPPASESRARTGGNADLDDDIPF